MILLYYLPDLIHMLVYIYFWLSYVCVPLANCSHKSHLILGRNPSRVLVKFLCAYPWFSISIPFPVREFKGPEGSILVRTYIHMYIHTYIYTHIHIHVYIHIHTDTCQMAEEVSKQIENAFNLIVSTTEQSGNMKKALKQKKN